ncbi:MAG: hypothetical protein K0S38_344 [Candidatus Paceibacter sp.]|jgi:hypothetical protein|nr:hypothetical protein [Candidatus Paceibacter sp.]
MIFEKRLRRVIKFGHTIKNNQEILSVRKILLDRYYSVSRFISANLKHSTMAEQSIRDQFLSVYNNRADDIFAYCYEQVAHREIAKYLTRNIFMRTWDLVSETGSRVVNIEKTLYRTAKDHINGFINSQRSHLSYKENLWNLTLSQ